MYVYMYIYIYREREMYSHQLQMLPLRFAHPLNHVVLYAQSPY